MPELVLDLAKKIMTEVIEPSFAFLGQEVPEGIRIYFPADPMDIGMTERVSIDWHVNDCRYGMKIDYFPKMDFPVVAMKAKLVRLLGIPYIAWGKNESWLIDMYEANPDAKSLDFAYGDLLFRPAERLMKLEDDPYTALDNLSQAKEMLWRAEGAVVLLQDRLRLCQAIHEVSVVHASDRKRQEESEGKEGG